MNNVQVEKRVLTIDGAAADQMRQCTMRREQNAKTLGVATVDYERLKAMIVQKIADDVAEQQAIGTAALTAIGIDPTSGTYQIDLDTNTVLRIVDGVAVSVCV